MSSGPVMAKTFRNVPGFLHLLDLDKPPANKRTSFKSSGAHPQWQTSHVLRTSPQPSGSLHQSCCPSTSPLLFPRSSAEVAAAGRSSLQSSPDVMNSQCSTESDRSTSTSSINSSSAPKVPKKQRLSINAFVQSWWTDRIPRRKSRNQSDPSEDCVSSECALEKTHSHSPEESSSSSEEFLQCPLCLVRQKREHFPELVTCPHRSCLDCLREYLRIEILESRINIKCPECFECLNPQDIRIILEDPDLTGKYEEFMMRRFLAAEPDCRWCPAPDCGFAVIANGCASCPKITCGRSGCGTEFCYHCKQLWHPDKTCDAARQEGVQNFELRNLLSSLSSHESEGDEMKQCPRCSAFINKTDDWGCNHMVCVLCGCEFCWLCMREISDLHYLSPSGCTFWGKKPWSQKKKILSLLSTLLGAPVAITLFASLAIPSIIVGIPIYVGRKVIGYYRCKEISKCKKNVIIAGGVSLSFVASPVIAVLTVAAGVPILLVYVYGVIPVSLFRTGVFRVPTVSSKGVKIRFDGDNENTVFRAAVAAAEAQPYIPNLHHGTSVFGPAGLSTSIGGGHMDCCGASSFHHSLTLENTTTAAGNSKSGAGSKGHYSRMQVKADVKMKPCELSRDSTTVDNVSTPATAGSHDGDAALERQYSLDACVKTLRHSSSICSSDESSVSSGSVMTNSDTDLCRCLSTHCCGKDGCDSALCNSSKKRTGKLWRRSCCKRKTSPCKSQVKLGCEN
ncbi:E3 ubiquitin-protein ligase RNF19A-like isoform X1 [Synchiropus splendidus]|uniref:E3 ubiquitin-protein ligase RNF19A-like isoform X1 n=2 Tax=Synchiropus splendidus TaxID=270530 RepID=UPI00237E3668|nr:E3 ubiquitin-protein ligase RNF19A-like isoform X1 [Synchiropus splendidus]